MRVDTTGVNIMDGRAIVRRDMGLHAGYGPFESPFVRSMPVGLARHVDRISREEDAGAH